MIVDTIPVHLQQDTYPIYVGNDLLSQAPFFTPHIHGQQVLIVTQKNVANYYLAILQKILRDYQCDVMLLPEGEVNKNINEWQKIFDVLLQKKHERSTTLIALGGGMVGDMTGFAAACYQRGVNYLQVPTTLIAQVDSAIGGKTAINHPLGKNMLGTFYHPQCVIADLNTLTTLPPREFIAGMAEVIKYGLMGDEKFFSWLEKNLTAVLQRNNDALLHVIRTSIRHKLQIVTQDEKDKGVRQLLNFGHTFGHALETAYAYQGLLHGEAVALGMLIAVELSAIVEKLPTAEVKRICQLLVKSGLYYPVAGFSLEIDLLELLKRDKKVHDNKVNVILLQAIGQAKRVADISMTEISLAVKRAKMRLNERVFNC